MDDKIFDQIQQVDLKKTMESSYIDYAMSVIASRALLMSGMDLSLFRGECSTLWLSSEIHLTSHTENVRVLSVIQWVNTIHTETAQSMEHS